MRVSLAGPDGKPLPGPGDGRDPAGAPRGQGDPARASAGPRRPFRYLDKGALAVVGRGKAVCEVRGLKLSGRPAFLTYLGVHLYYLGGVPGRRLEVLIDVGRGADSATAAERGDRGRARERRAGAAEAADGTTR